MNEVTHEAIELVHKLEKVLGEGEASQQETPKQEVVTTEASNPQVS